MQWMSWRLRPFNDMYVYWSTHSQLESVFSCNKFGGMYKNIKTYKGAGTRLAQRSRGNWRPK